MGKWLGPPHEEIPKCGAKTRAGHPCGHFSMRNGKCRYHGGKSTGANEPHRPLKHGFYTKDEITNRRSLYELLRLSVETIKEI